MKNHRAARSEQIFFHAIRHSTPCRSPEGIPCIIVPTSPFSQDVFPIRSVLFRDWLADTFHREHDLFPSLGQLRNALHLIEARARRADLANQSLALRTTSRGNPFDPTAILLDLANPAAEAVEITAEGWQITTGASREFRRARAQRPLPAPQSPSGFQPDLQPAAAAWLLAALRPIGPYPI